MTSERDSILNKRLVLMKRYGALFEEMASIIFEADPMGINFGSNTDEYYPEVGSILPRLTKFITADEVSLIIYEEFCNWFGEESVGDRENYHELAFAIWQLWNESNHNSKTRLSGGAS